MIIYKGNIVYSISKDELKEFEQGYILVDDEGKVVDVLSSLPKEYKDIKVIDYKDSLIIPAFADLHVHAPQYPNRGIAMDKLLAEWLNDYTFPLESKYKDDEFARKVYSKFVDDLIKRGTMHAVIFGTIYNSSTNILIDLLEEKGINSYVGKVNMDKGSPDFYIEDMEQSLKDTEEFLNRNKDNKYAKPIVTPRFAPTCSFELLKELGKLSNKYGIGVQTHVVESLWETEESKKCFDGCRCDMQIYEETGLLTQPPFIAAHYIFPSQEDIDLLKKCHGFAVQCPDSTTNVIAGIMRTGYLLDNGINIGYGSDISAGSYLGIYTQVSSSIGLSKMKKFYEPENRAINFKEAFYIATKSGGSIFGKVGSFEKGYYFDALVIDNMQDDFKKVKPSELAERFCYTGESSDIVHKYLRGKEI